MQNTGEFTGQQAGDDADAYASSFGEGDVTNLQNVSTGPGGAISTGGDATGNYVHAEEGAIVQTEQGEGDATQNVQQTTDIDVNFDLSRGAPEPILEPVRFQATSEESGGEDSEGLESLQ